jgi:hypothetical protein
MHSDPRSAISIGELLQNNLPRAFKELALLNLDATVFAYHSPDIIPWAFRWFHDPDALLPIRTVRQRQSVLHLDHCVRAIWHWASCGDVSNGALLDDELACVVSRTSLSDDRIIPRTIFSNDSIPILLPRGGRNI